MRIRIRCEVAFQWHQPNRYCRSEAPAVPHWRATLAAVTCRWHRLHPRAPRPRCWLSTPAAPSAWCEMKKEVSAWEWVLSNIFQNLYTNKSIVQTIRRRYAIHIHIGLINGNRFFSLSLIWLEWINKSYLVLKWIWITSFWFILMKSRYQLKRDSCARALDIKNMKIVLIDLFIWPILRNCCDGNKNLDVNTWPCLLLAFVNISAFNRFNRNE